jgi:zinc protease
MMVLGKNRSANEPERKAGITDFVNRCLEKGTATRSARELADDLAQIGAQVTLYDNPWIPYDDRYTTRQFSFLKFETIDEFALKGFHLFNEMLFMPAFDSAEVENVRRSMLGVLGRQSDSPRDVARDLFYATLFDGTAYAQSVMGTPQTISNITLDDLRRYHAAFYSPENLVVAIVTSRPADEIMAWFKSGPARLARARAELLEVGLPQPPVDAVTVRVPMEKEQVTLYLGGLLPEATSDDAVPISVATSILSERLYSNLREREGLAYSVGAGDEFGQKFGWYYCAMGTAAENYDRAVRGILLEIEKLQFDGPLAVELNRARNSIWGRLMSAKLSAINQAYYLAVDRFLGRPVPYDPDLLDDLGAVGREDVRRVMSRYFSVERYVLAAAGKVASGDGE